VIAWLDEPIGHHEGPIRSKERVGARKRDNFPNKTVQKTSKLWIIHKPLQEHNRCLGFVHRPRLHSLPIFLEGRRVARQTVLIVVRLKVLLDLPLKLSRRIREPLNSLWMAQYERHEEPRPSTPKAFVLRFAQRGFNVPEGVRCSLVKDA
jgi:hypothetical protein